MLAGRPPAAAPGASRAAAGGRPRIYWVKWALNQRPNSDWVVEIVTNATIVVNRILQRNSAANRLRRNSAATPRQIQQSVTGLEKDHHGRPYVDNLCLFRCMGLHLGHDPNTLYAKYTDQPVETFEGVTIDELQKAETLFEVNIIVYKLIDNSAQLVRRSLCKHANTMYLNLHETHFSLIHDIKAYSHSYKCSKCEHSLWKYPAWLERHELTCEAGVRHVYKGGVYHTTPSVFQRLDDEGNHRRRHAEILPLSSNIRLRMLLRWRGSTCQQRTRPVDRSSRSVECECGFQRAGA